MKKQKSKHNQNPQSHPTAEELLKKAELEKEAQRKRSKINYELLPFMLDNTTSVEDAKLFIQVVSQAINQEFVNRLRTTKLSDLEMSKFINPEAEHAERYSKLFDMFSDESIKDALEMIDGFPNMIEKSLRNEFKERDLKSLNIELLQ